MKHLGVVSYLFAFIISLATAVFSTERRRCCCHAGMTSLATDPQYELKNNPAIKSVTSTIKTTAAPANTQYCNVILVYGTDPNQNITIAVGLPLSATDGGSGGIEGAWNGRTEGLGGGGCAGNLNVDAAVNAGYVGSGTDGGHSGGDCTPGVNANHTYNLEFIQDFFRVASSSSFCGRNELRRAITAGCPAIVTGTGARPVVVRDSLLAQELGNQLDGVLANAPAMYWTRFQTAQMWDSLPCSIWRVNPRARSLQASSWRRKRQR